MKNNKSNSSVKKTFTIQNRLGLHARAAAQFVQITNRFKSDILVSKGKQEINGKSIMGVMMLAAAEGSRITVTANGDDAENLIYAIEKLINDKFGED
ncbi:MAG: HPr family phosphocarrier protein [Deltaproteobacteria bacterium]|nr:HPr family phosphocarrier protein [Deltaproteobacteria bacterium]